LTYVSLGSVSSLGGGLEGKNILFFYREGHFQVGHSDSRHTSSRVHSATAYRRARCRCCPVVAQSTGLADRHDRQAAKKRLFWGSFRECFPFGRPYSRGAGGVGRGALYGCLSHSRPQGGPKANSARAPARALRGTGLRGCAECSVPLSGLPTLICTILTKVPRRLRPPSDSVLYVFQRRVLAIVLLELLLQLGAGSLALRHCASSRRGGWSSGRTRASGRRRCTSS